MIGTGAISNLHARAYRNIGYRITVCTDIFEEAGRRFAAANGAEFVKTYQEVCRHPEVDYVDVCTFPDFRLEPVRLCAETGKHVQVQKPVATNLETAREMIDVAHPNAGRGRLTTTFVFADDRARVLPCARKASYDPSVV